MGIKNFASWFRNNFPNRITNFAKSNYPLIKIDNFMIDLNGVFHNSAQKVFQYGNFAKQVSLLRPRKVSTNPETLYKTCFEDICKTIDELVAITRPIRRLVLAIDGVAPLSKQNQQRQRRYRGIVENSQLPDGAFDPNCITPGTKFMDSLSKYIDWHIRKNISDGTWKFEVVFSNEKCPGEGEHKLINYIRKFGIPSETYCINALDADLFMLSLGTHMPKFYLLREDLYDPNYDYMYVGIGDVKADLVKLMKWSEDCDPNRLVDDFILICFLCGNDFLPNIPSISIMENGLDMIIDFYKTNKSYLVVDSKINLDAFKSFLQLISNSEKDMMIRRINNKSAYIEDTILSKFTEDNFVMNEYQESYNARHFTDVERDAHSYIEGCHWVLSYYLKGISNWEWMYSNSYSLFASDIVKYISTFQKADEKPTGPLLPFQQLLCVLPPKSFKFIPKPLDKLYLEFPEFYPDNFKINYEGKKKKWEGVVELPPIDVDRIKSKSDKLLKNVSEDDSTRNIVSIPVIYNVDQEFMSEFRSVFGTIKKSRVSTEDLIF